MQQNRDDGVYIYIPSETDKGDIHMGMTTVEFLTRSKELIVDPANWTKHATFRDKDGNELKKPYLFTPELPIFIEKVHSFNVWGACEFIDLTVKDTYHASGQSIGVIGNQVRKRTKLHYIFFESELESPAPHDFNDRCTHAAMMKLFDDCIQEAKDNERTGRYYDGFGFKGVY